MAISNGNESTNAVDYKIRPKPKWLERPYAKRNLWQRVATIELASEKCYMVQPKNPDPPPTMSAWRERCWLACHIAPALIIHVLWYQLVPESSFCLLYTSPSPRD